VPGLLFYSISYCTYLVFYRMFILYIPIKVVFETLNLWSMNLRSYFVETLFFPHKVTLGSRALPGKPMFYLSRGPTRSLLSWSFAIKTTEYFFFVFQGVVGQWRLRKHWYVLWEIIKRINSFGSKKRLSVMFKQTKYMVNTEIQRG
jgi:hypothetical protein